MAGVGRKSRATCVHTFLPDVDDSEQNGVADDKTDSRTATYDVLTGRRVQIE